MRLPAPLAYEVLSRATSSPEWEHAQSAGNTTRATLPISKDNVIFAVRAVDEQGTVACQSCRSPNASHLIRWLRLSQLAAAPATILRPSNCPMAPRRTFSLSLPPFTKAVKWLILANAGVYLLVTLLQAFAPGLGDVIGYVCPWSQADRLPWLGLATGDLFLPACGDFSHSLQHDRVMDVRRTV